MHCDRTIIMKSVVECYTAIYTRTRIAVLELMRRRDVPIVIIYCMFCCIPALDAAWPYELNWPIWAVECGRQQLYDHGYAARWRVERRLIDAGGKVASNNNAIFRYPSGSMHLKIIQLRSFSGNFRAKHDFSIRHQMNDTRHTTTEKSQKSNSKSSKTVCFFSSFFMIYVCRCVRVCQRRRKKNEEMSLTPALVWRSTRFENIGKECLMCLNSFAYLR